MLRQLSQLALRKQRCSSLTSLTTVSHNASILNVPSANFAAGIRRVTKESKEADAALDDLLDIPKREPFDPRSSHSISRIKQNGSTLRFYNDVSISPEEDGRYALKLNNQVALTPHNLPLILPNKAYAMMVALEFENQRKYIYPQTMPLTDFALTVTDRLSWDRDSMTENCMGMFVCDSTIYRADSDDYPIMLKQQQKYFDPLFEWMKSEYNIDLKFTYGYNLIDHTPEAMATMEAQIRSLDDYTFAVFESLCRIGKSPVIALAFVKYRINNDQCFRALRLEENVQMEMCGRVEGMFGNVIPEEYAKHQVAAGRTVMNLLNYKL